MSLELKGEQVIITCKHALITVCCALMAGVGYFIMMPAAAVAPEWFWIGLGHMLLGALTTFVCTNDWLIHPYLRSRKS